MIVKEIKMDNLQDILWKIPETPGSFTYADLFGEIKTAIADNEHEYEFIVGTDSQSYGKTFMFITVLCILKKGKGGTYFYKTEISSQAKSYHNNHKLRIFDEIAKTIECASIITENTGYKPIVHLDVNSPHKREFTSAFSDQLRGWVISCGFEAVTKPLAFVASCVANRHTKNRKHKRKVRK